MKPLEIVVRDCAGCPLAYWPELDCEHPASASHERLPPRGRLDSCPLRTQPVTVRLAPESSDSD